MTRTWHLLRLLIFLILFFFLRSLLFPSYYNAVVMFHYCCVFLSRALVWIAFFFFCHHFKYVLDYKMVSYWQCLGLEGKCCLKLWLMSPGILIPLVILVGHIFVCKVIAVLVSFGMRISEQKYIKVQQNNDKKRCMTRKQAMSSSASFSCNIETLLFAMPFSDLHPFFIYLLVQLLHLPQWLTFCSGPICSYRVRQGKDIID